MGRQNRQACLARYRGNITISENPHKLDRNIETALKKMVKKWRKTKKKNEK